MSGAAEQPFDQRLRRVETLVETLERVADPAARAAARELVQTLLELHRAGLARLLGLAGAAITEACAGDDLVGGLLLLHGLHPVALEARVRQALERVRPALRARGGGVEVLAVDGDLVRLGLEGGRDGPVPDDLRRAVEEAVWAAAPDAGAVAFEGTATRADRGRVPLPLVGAPRPP